LFILMRAFAGLIVLSLAALRAHAETLGCDDVGIFSDLDAQVRLELPRGLDPAHLHTVRDPAHEILVLYEGKRPIKVYPFRGELRAADKAELAGLVDPGRPSRILARGQPPAPGDRDGDGIPDPLDVLLGAKKLLLNGADYIEGYKEVAFPNGDVPRHMGVCTDVLVRALRNAGFDLQAELHADIGRAPRAYPMVKRRNPSIDHRRVKTLAPFFRRQLERHGIDPRDAKDPWWPGDILFMDTFPNRPGPDHVGIVSDRVGPSGLPLVINNWAPGSEDAEMDLLPFVPVTERYRLPESRDRTSRSSRPARSPGR
jgi:uncharacterized protein YijF (DUF1287 family)